MMTLIAFIVTIGILVTIHEYGHYQVARWCGVKVLRFSIGFGKPLWQKTFGKDKTELVIASIPLGGFVKMLDERELSLEQTQNPDIEQVVYSPAELSRSFNRQSVWKRIAIVLAGPLANLLLAILLFWILFLLGETGMRPIIGEISPNSFAEKAGFTEMEVIKRIGDKPIKTWQEARWQLLEITLGSQNSVAIETVDRNNVLQNRILAFSNIGKDAEQDVLDKLGFTIHQPQLPAVIGEILPNSAATKGGLKTGDIITQIDKKTIADWQAVVKSVQQNPNKPLNMTVKRANVTLAVMVTPDALVQNNQTIGRIGASVKVSQKDLSLLWIELSYTPLQAFYKAVIKTRDTAIFSLKMLGKMIMGEVSLKGISGPATIAQYAGESANLGIKTFLGFLALVSISIGVLNLLPIPVLDGGHLMYYIAEIIKGSPVSEYVMLVGQKIGFAVLGLLMSIAIFNDINRLIAS